MSSDVLPPRGRVRPAGGIDPVPVAADVLALHVWGDRVRLERMARGWSQNHLARVAGIPQSEISRLENHRAARPGVTTRLVAIATAFGLEADAVFPMRRRTDPARLEDLEVDQVQDRAS